MSEEPKEASKEAPDEITFDITTFLEDNMTTWQDAHALEDMARMALDLEREDMWAGFRMAEEAALEKLFIKLVDSQSNKFKSVLQKHIEDIRKGRDAQYDRIKAPWDAFQQMEENIAKEIEDESKPNEIVPLEVPEGSKFDKVVTPGHSETCACWSCEDRRRAIGV